jgi:hypothetical protein
MSRDMRKYSRQTTIGLIIGGLLLLFVVGGGLIYLIYGQGAALTGLTCLLFGLIPIGIIALVLWLLGWVTKRIDKD